MSKVLVFESDAPFAEQLKSELQALSHQVTVIDEPSMGLQSAAADRPDLILLSVELPRMSGFSVCGKLKRDTNLKDVPVIIMSTDATEETFEQHRRLRTHAEVYLKKPISFAELSKHLELYLGSPGGDNGSPSSEILIDDEVDFVETEIEVDSQSDPMAGSDGNASDAAAFAEQALGALLDDEH
ncbi:MAG TPA: response regulator, partial [Polyangiaceae bacterium]|nr:response regulator [Polyangiaceae bacterium]